MISSGCEISVREGPRHKIRFRLIVTGERMGPFDDPVDGTSGTEELQLRRLSDDPIVVALPKRHPAAALEEIDLAILKDDPFLLFPWEIAPTLYDTIVDAHAVNDVKGPETDFNRPKIRSSART